MPQTSDSDPYTIVACGFHDRLEHWAVRRQPVSVVWRDADGEHHATTTLDDVLAHDGADWVRLGTGAEIRADRIVSVDGITPGAC